MPKKSKRISKMSKMSKISKTSSDEKNEKNEKKSPQRLITDYLTPPSSNQNNQNNEDRGDNHEKKIYGYDSITECWHCVICGENLGKSNSRQLCGKSFCYNEPYNY